ncbi:iron-containing alcohol dehydrogenase [Oleiphilus messinensis]|uniref:Iron-containing alcohol dehydrogenase n=1 Tax=Oleiphilus messinensis TaxID=141451 RepID=A0A1Y0IFM5_9GAMM|nr:iron-containing alcohol dehydrogenase [Oleiphilus messinensis]ARU59332.1 iron-containing alcohol dehydrogenase [Oleiphilus messinensis]
MTPFQFNTTKSLISEAGAADNLAEICQPYAPKNILIVTDPGILKAGLLESVLPPLQARYGEIQVFSDVEADPAERTVNNAIELARSTGVDLVIGFGGGSSMDVAKLVALIASPKCTQSLSDTYGVNQAAGERLPLIQVPTTAGTGSEVTPIAIVTTGETTKSGIVSPILFPDVAVLDAKLTTGLPAAVTAATGIDAMVHAIEAYTSKIRKNPISDMFAREALHLLARNIEQAVHQGQNLEARSGMLLGANLAGQAFANAPVAAVHALAYPLGGHFHIPHGLSNSLVLPQVMRFNMSAAQAHYAELAPIIMGEDYLPGEHAQICEQLVQWLENLIIKVTLPNRLRDCGVPESMLPQLAADAMLQQRLLVNNPRTMTEADALAIYQAAY